jgi:hypothetical protein
VGEVEKKKMKKDELELTENNTFCYYEKYNGNFLFQFFQTAHHRK